MGGSSNPSTMVGAPPQSFGNLPPSFSQNFQRGTPPQNFQRGTPQPGTAPYMGAFGSAMGQFGSGGYRPGMMQSTGMGQFGGMARPSGSQMINPLMGGMQQRPPMQGGKGGARPPMQQPPGVGAGKGGSRPPMQQPPGMAAGKGGRPPMQQPPGNAMGKGGAMRQPLQHNFGQGIAAQEQMLQQQMQGLDRGMPKQPEQLTPGVEPVTAQVQSTAA